jgi:hypothetical protein
MKCPFDGKEIYDELTGIIEDAVEFGFGVAHKQSLKTILKQIKKPPLPEA